MLRVQKLLKEEWLEIEVEASEFEQRIVNMMLQAGTIYDAGDFRDKIKLEVLGEDLYQELVQDKVKKLYFPSDDLLEGKKNVKKTEKNKKAAPGGKGGKHQKKGKNDVYEKFMKTEKKKKIEDLFHDIYKSNADALFRQKNFGFSCNILEFKLISFMSLGKLLKDKEDWIYEIIIGLKKCLQAYENYQGKLFYDEKGENLENVNVSASLIDDIKSFLANLIESSVFSMRITFIRYPKLIYHTIFDSYFESIKVKPYNSQKELFLALRNYYKDKTLIPRGLLIFYKAMIGSGKTTGCLALASLVRDLRTTQPKYKKLVVIFCCGLAQIRVQIGQLAYNSIKTEKQISFAVATLTEQNTVRVINHFSCKDDPSPILIISDLETTSVLLDTFNPIVLFLDEPIIDADQETSPITEIFLKILAKTPEVTILSSATLPNPEHVPNLIASYRRKHKNSEIMTIYSEQAKVAQQIYVNFSEKYYPHNGCKTYEELATVLKSVRNNPFLARLYTGPSLYHFEAKMKKLNIQQMLSKGIEEKFSEPENMSQKYIQEHAFELIESLLQYGNDEQIADFCKEDVENIIDISNFKWEDLATKKAYMFIGGCLIATPAPLEFAKKAFGQFVAKVSLKAILKEYNQKKEVFDSEMKKFEEIKNDEEKLKKRSQYANENTPNLLFPEYMKINLKAHLQKYSDLEKPELVGYRKDFLLEDLVLKIDEDLNLMLFSGIGIFESDKILNEEYNKTVRNKAKYGELAYLISNKDILYGANYPLNNVIIDDDFVDIYSINTIFQTMGRAGRIGQAWKSNSYIGEKIKKRLNEFIIKESHNDFISIEAINIEKKIIENSESDTEEDIEKAIEEDKEKIAIYFNINSFDAVIAMISCFLYYTHKLQNIYKKNLSDIDIFQIIKLFPLDNIETIESLESIDKAYFIGVFPINAKQNIEVIKNCRKIVYIDHLAYNRQRYIYFQKNISLNSAIKTEFLEIFDNIPTSQLCYKYFREKLNKKFSLNVYNPIFPSYVKKSYNQTFNSPMFEMILKLIEENEMTSNIKAPESKIVLNYLMDKAQKYWNAYGICLKTIWKIATLNLDLRDPKEKKKFKAKVTTQYNTLLNKCENLVNEMIKVSVLPLNQKNCIILPNVPSSYYMFKSLIREFLVKKSEALHIKQNIFTISWISYKHKENLLFNIYSLENSLNCDEFIKNYGGMSESKCEGECIIAKKEIHSWKLSVLISK